MNQTAICLESHTVFWLIPFRFEKNGVSLSAELARLATAGALPEARRPDATNREDVWKPATTGLKSDLLPHVQRLLGATSKVAGDGKTGAVSHPKLPPLAASDKVLGLLGNRRPNMAVAISPSALSRLGLARPVADDGKPARVVLPFSIDAAHLYRFTTGTGVLVIELHYGAPERLDGGELDLSPLSAGDLVLEGNHVLGHARRSDAFYWRSSFARGRPDGGKVSAAVFEQADELSLSAIAGMLLGTVDGASENDASRLYSYSAVTLAAECTSDCRMLALRLARRYTRDYSPNPDDCNIYQPFADVLHASEFEGAASVVHAGRNVEFLGDYSNRVVRPTLLPMLILAIHEQAFLLDLADSSSAGYLNAPSEARRAAFLRRQRERFLDYRLNFRFEYAARLSAQNGVYRLWREGLRAEEIADGLDEDLASMAALEQERSERFRRRLERVKLALISGAGVFLVAEQITKAALPESGLGVTTGTILGLAAAALSYALKEEVSVSDKLVALSSRLIPDIQKH